MTDDNDRLRSACRNFYHSWTNGKCTEEDQKDFGTLLFNFIHLWKYDWEKEQQKLLDETVEVLEDIIADNEPRLGADGHPYSKEDNVKWRIKHRLEHLKTKLKQARGDVF